MSVVRMSNVNVETGLGRALLCVGNRIAETVAFVATSATALSEIPVAPELQVGNNKGRCDADQDAKRPKSNNKFPQHFHSSEMGIARLACNVSAGNNLFHAQSQGIVTC